MKLNVVSFQMPSPPDYGGVIDVYHKLRALSEAGADITLHTFIYGTDRWPDDPELQRFCRRIHCYPRRRGLLHQLSTKPYIVGTRTDSLLLSRLLADRDPVLLEGLHCCSLLQPLRSAGVPVAVRLHNVEHHYYRALAAKAPRLSQRRLFFNVESSRLRRYENVLALASALLPISDTDFHYFRRRFPRVPALYLPPFFDDTAAAPDDEPLSVTAPPDLLYHGNLAVSENANAALWTARRVMPLTRSGARLTVAGRRPDGATLQALQQAGATVAANPSEPLMHSLIASARVNLLVTDQPTGMKLKLMRVLTQGRGHCLVNSAMITDPAMARYCTVADTPDQLAQAIDRLTAHPLTPAQADARRRDFLSRYGTARSAARLLECMANLR